MQVKRGSHTQAWAQNAVGRPFPGAWAVEAPRTV